MHSFAALVTSLSKLTEMYKDKTHCPERFVDFSSSDFNVEGHIVSTDEDAL